MDYLKIYNQLINRAKLRKLTSYKEKHHIVPKCLGGNDDKSNIAELTAREHFICHWLLIRIYPNSGKLAYAFMRMCNARTSKNNQRDYIISSRAYEECKERFAIANSKIHKNKKLSKKTKKKLRDFNLGKKLSQETKDKIAYNSRNMPQVTRDKISKAHRGKKLSKEHIKILSIKNKLAWQNKTKEEKEIFGRKISKKVNELLATGWKPNTSGFKPHKKGEFNHTEKTKIKLSKFRKDKKLKDIIGEDAANKMILKLKSQTKENNFNYRYVDIEKVKEYLYNKLKLDEISKILNTSMPTIISRFKEKTGLSITEYKMLNKINKQNKNGRIN